VTIERIQKLSDRSGASRAKTVENAIYNDALREGIIDEEQREMIDELVERYGADAGVVIAVVEGTSNTPVSINGKPTGDLQAAATPGAITYWTEHQDRPEWPKEWDVRLWIPNSGILFRTVKVEPPAKIELKLGELHDWRTPPEPRTVFSVQFNREIRRAHGIEVDEED
jgi:hypothetical protein